jgi:hypothetical protein
MIVNQKVILIKIFLLIKYSNLYESRGRSLFFYRKGAEGARCMIHLNSQAKGPLLDRTLESFLINTEGVIFHYLSIMKKISQVKRQSRNNL